MRNQKNFGSGLALFEGNLEWFCFKLSSKPRWGETTRFELSTVYICFDSLHRAALSHDKRREPDELVIKKSSVCQTKQAQTTNWRQLILKSGLCSVKSGQSLAGQLPRLRS